MRGLMSSSAVGLGLAAAIVLGGCAFRPDGGTGTGDDDGDDVTGDAGDPDGDAQPAIDAADDPVPDARPSFDLATCPDSYSTVTNAPSRYRMINALPWAAAAAACTSHSNGLTHLAVFSGQGERDAVGAALFFSGDFRRTWLGVYNLGTGVRTVTGEPVYPDGDVEAGQAVSWIRDLLRPFRSEGVGTSYAALCECDGRPSTP